MISVVIDDRQVIDHRDYTLWRVDGAFAAAITSDFTVLERRVAMFQVLAGNPQPVTDRVQGKQIFGACINTVATGSAQIVDDNGHIVFIHVNGVGIADELTVGQP